MTGVQTCALPIFSQTIADQQNDPDSILNQTKEKAGNISDKVKGTAANLMDRGGDLLENLAEKAHGLAGRMGTPDK